MKLRKYKYDRGGNFEHFTNHYRNHKFLKDYVVIDLDDDVTVLCDACELAYDGDCPHDYDLCDCVESWADKCKYDCVNNPQRHCLTYSHCYCTCEHVDRVCEKYK